MAAKPDHPKLRMKYKGIYHAPTHGPEEDLDKELSIPAKEIDRRSLLRSNLSNTTTCRLKSKAKPSSETETSRALYDSAFPGWAASTLPTGLAARHLLQEALIPSPLSENAWAKLERQRKNAWMDVVDHTSSGTRALYHYIRENLPDVDNRIFGGREFPLQCREGLICNLVQEDTSANRGYYVNSQDTKNDPTSMLRTRWINGDYMIPLDSKAGIGELQESAEGRSPQGAATSLELRRLYLVEEERYGFFIINTHLAPLFINGVTIGLNMVAGPLPDFAVIEVGDLTLFWWCTLKGVDSIPKDFPTRPGGEPEGSKRYLGEVQGYEDFNDVAPSVKRPRFDEGMYVATSNSFGLPSHDVEQANKNGGTRRTNDHGSSAAPQPEEDRSTQKDKDTLHLSSSWKDDYHRRMEACKARAKTDGGKDTLWAVHRLTRTESLVIDDVFFPIAAVWYGLVQQNIRFAFGTKNLFESARSSRARGMVCVLSPNNFIIPLMFEDGVENATDKSSQTVEAKPMRTRSQYRKLGESAKVSNEAGLTSKDVPLKPTVEQPNQSGSHAGWQGHGILVIAERADSSDKGDSATLTCFDSRSDLNNHDRIRRAARNIVQNSRWTKTRPTWTGESWPAVAQQRDGNLAPMASGVHVVLNAWAYMLNIPLAANPRLSEQFYAKARKVIKMSVKGGLDSETIRAFMQAYKYAVPQDLAATRQGQETGNSTVNGLRLMRSVYINERIFNDIIDRLQRRERGESIDRDDDAPPGDGGGSTGPRRGPARGVKPGSKGDKGVPEEDPSEPEIKPPPPGGDPSDPGEGPSDPAGAPRRPASWEAILNDGLGRHSQLYEQWRASSTFEHKARTRINRPDDLDDDSVVLAIASLWEALRQARITFSFGTVNSFRFYRSSEDRHQSRNDTVIHGQRPLVMPLLFHAADDHEAKEDELGKGKGKGDIRPTDRNASGIGHFVLATAEKNDRGQVQITIRNSGPRHLGRDHAARIACSFITYSGWMGIDNDGNQLMANPDFAPVAHPKVPVQRCGNTCGLYVILNAWAYMLGVPVRREREATRGHTHGRFHAKALEIINLALAGFMDSLTIQAFLIVWEYAVQQDVNDQRMRVRRVNAARMDPATLGTLVYEQRMLERLQASPPELTEAQITQLIDMGFSRKRAIQQLRVTGGMADRAVEQLTNEGANIRTTPVASYTPQDEDIQALMAVGDFSRKDVDRELTRSSGDRNEAMVRLFDQMTTRTPPTNTRAESPPPQSVAGAEPPRTELEHPYDEEDIGRLMSYRNISAEVVVRELDRAEGNVGVAEERIRHLSQALSSTSGSRSNSDRNPGNEPSIRHSSSHSGSNPDSAPPKRSSAPYSSDGPESRPSKKRCGAHAGDGADNRCSKKRPRTRSSHNPNSRLSKTSKPVSSGRSSARLSKSTYKPHSGDGPDGGLPIEPFKCPSSHSEDNSESKHSKRTSKSGSTEEPNPEPSKSSSDPHSDDEPDAGPSKRRSDSDSSQGPDTKSSKATTQSRRKDTSPGSQETNRNPNRHPDKGPGSESSKTISHTSANRLSYSGSAVRPHNWSGHGLKASNSSLHSRIDNTPRPSKTSWHSRSRKVATPGPSKSQSHPQSRRDATPGPSSNQVHVPPTQDSDVRGPALPANGPISDEDIDEALALWHWNFDRRRQLIATTPFELNCPAWEYQGRIIGRMIGNEARGIALIAANIARIDGQAKGKERSNIDTDLKYRAFSGRLLENVLDAKRGARVATDSKASKKLKLIDLEDYDTESELEETEDPDTEATTIDLVGSDSEQEANDVEDSDSEQKAEGMEGPEAETEIIDITESSTDLTDDYGFAQKPISHDSMFAIETMKCVARRPLAASAKAPATSSSAAAVKDSVVHLGTSSAGQKPVDPRLGYSALIDPRLNQSRLGNPSVIDPRLINPSTSEELYTTSVPKTPPPRSLVDPRLDTSSASNDFRTARIPTTPPPRPYCSLQRVQPLPEEDIETLVAIGHSRKEAFRALDLYKGDLAQAMCWLGYLDGRM